jgi:hypothetical protein
MRRRSTCDDIPYVSHTKTIGSVLTTPLDRGQGANNAFYSAHCLVEALKSVQAGSSTLTDAITSYDESIWIRGANEVQISKAQTFFTHDGLENFINSPVMKLGTKPSHAAKSEGYQ